jgi:hypothetical protein
MRRAADCGQGGGAAGAVVTCDGPRAAELRRSCHQNHNVTISASRPKSTKALGLNTAARISEVGLNAPQNRVGKSVGMRLDRGGEPRRDQPAAVAHDRLPKKIALSPINLPGERPRPEHTLSGASGCRAHRSPARAADQHFSDRCS